MRLPTPLLRRKSNVHKNQFGHVLILAGSRGMLGAAALTGLAAMRAGAGLATLGIPQSLNAALQKKSSPVLMTLPLPETKAKSIDLTAHRQLMKELDRFNAIAIGPGLSNHPSTKKFILKMISTVRQPSVIDADALNALAGNLKALTMTRGIKILTPHPGEMARLTGKSKQVIETARQTTAKEFAVRHHCVLLLKGHRTVVASPKGKIYINRTGNAGMATAGSGDVLTGIISAFLAQGLAGFEAACWGTYVHGTAGDLAAKAKSKTSLIATDIIDHIPMAFKKLS